MAPPKRFTATTSSTAQRTQPSNARRGPPYTNEYVNAHPELCLAPRMMPISLPEEETRRNSHTLFPTAYVPPRTGRDAGGALHFISLPYGQQGGGQTPSSSHRSQPPHTYPARDPIAYSAPVVPAATNAPAMPLFANGHPFTQTQSIPIPKPRHSMSPPTPDPSPTRPAPVHGRRKRTCADSAQHGEAPTT